MTAHCCPSPLGTGSDFILCSPIQGRGIRRPPKSHPSPRRPFSVQPSTQTGLNDETARESDATIQSQLGRTQAAALVSVSLIVDGSDRAESALLPCPRPAPVAPDNPSLSEFLTPASIIPKVVAAMQGRDGGARLQMTGRRTDGVGVRSAGIVAHSTLTRLMQVDLVWPVDCPQAIHRIIPKMWIITCVIHTVIPTMWITRFSIHISRHPRVVQMNSAQTTYRHDKPKMNAPRRKSTLRLCMNVGSHAGGLHTVIAAGGE